MCLTRDLQEKPSASLPDSVSVEMRNMASTKKLGSEGGKQSLQQGGTAQRKAQAPWTSVEIGTPLVVRVLAFFRSLEPKSSMQAGNTVYNIDRYLCITA